MLRSKLRTGAECIRTVQSLSSETWNLLENSEFLKDSKFVLTKKNYIT